MVALERKTTATKDTLRVINPQGVLMLKGVSRACFIKGECGACLLQETEA